MKSVQAEAENERPIAGGYFSILPLRMQEVQTRIRFRAPLTTALTDCKFKFQRRLVTLWA
jgi:hypothetical protein